MHSIISPNQGSSIPGRGTDTNYIIASEILHSMKSCRNKGWFAIKLDLEKAFDRLEWDFIFKCLTSCKIDVDTIHLIMSCISTSSSQVVFNGYPSPSFIPTRGIRQGDPLSPYLFIICMEALSTLIHRACADHEWTPFPLGRGGASFSHLLFADDILLFGRTNEDTLCALQNTIYEFCLASGQKININKSKMHISKFTPLDQASLFETALGLKQSNSLGTYLGFPLTNKKPSRGDTQPIIDKISSKLANWKTKFLSRAGRLCLIQSTLNAIPAYYMQCLHLPSSTINNINKIVRNFLWSGTSTKKLHLVNWNQVTLPKLSGGLGIHNSTSLNLSLSTKLCWKTLFLQQSSLSLALRSKYIAHRRQPLPFPSGSHIWQNVGRGWPILNNSLIWSVGNGESINFWYDKWTAIGPIRSLIYGPLLSPYRKVSTIIHDGLWRLEDIEFELPNNIIVAILASPLPRSTRIDRATSSLITNNGFSLQKTYAAAYSALNPTFNPLPSICENLQWLWAVHTQPRILMFIWLVWWDRLPHKATLFSRSITTNSACDLCHHPNENSLHILRDCAFARDVWSKFSLPSDFFTSDTQTWIYTNCSTSNTSWATMFSFLIWRLWLRRNNIIFKSTYEPTTSYWIDLVSQQCFEWSSARNSPQPITPPTTTVNPIRWAPPTNPWKKLNVDASHSSTSLLVGIGCVLRDSRGSWIIGWTRRCLASTPLMSEMLAIREGLNFGTTVNDSIMLCSDCQIAVKLIQGNTLNMNRLDNIANLVLECRELLKTSPHLQLIHEKRPTNVVADALARFSTLDQSNHQGCFDWNVMPPFIVELCNIDSAVCAELSPDPPP